MEAIKNCQNCLWENHPLVPGVCEKCSEISNADNPYPKWVPIVSFNTHCPDYHKDDPEKGPFDNLKPWVEEDIVNHPKHYTVHPSGVECIQITEHMNFCLGNAMKYIWRAGDKHETPLEDLKKAKWYIEREIQRLEKL